MNALKERAGVVAALADGTQTVLVRGPDLPPSCGDGRFVLYPAYTHQRPERYDPRHEHYYNDSRAKPEEGIPIRAVARVVAEYEVSADAPGSLTPYYVYSERGLREKYDLGAARVVLLRVATLDEPRLIAERPAYRGCRSWIELDDEVDVDLDGDETCPVLDEGDFAERRAAIKDSLGESDSFQTVKSRSEF